MLNDLVEPKEWDARKTFLAEKSIELPLQQWETEELEDWKKIGLRELESLRNAGKGVEAIQKVESAIKHVSEVIVAKKESVALKAQKVKTLKDAGLSSVAVDHGELPHHKQAEKPWGVGEVRDQFEVLPGTRPYSATDLLHLSKSFTDAGISLVYTSHPNHPKVQKALKELKKVYDKAFKAVMEVHNEAEEARLERISARNKAV